jgi:hypothetical protein
MISDKYKCIFVHIPKVAGQSIEHVFLDLHGLTWETREPLLLRLNDNPTIGPPRLAHLMASEYVSCGHVSQDTFNAYFKFAFVRNPWSRLISFYKYLGYADRLTFSEFIHGEFMEKEWKENLWFVGPQYDYIYDKNGNQLVDYVGKFEELQKGFDSVCTQLELPQTKLPFVNPTGHGKGGMRAFKDLVKKISPFHVYIETYDHYSKYYDSRTQKIVSDLYARDIEAFGYNFERW